MSDLHFKLRIPPELMDRLKEDAERKRRSVTSLILEFIENGLASEGGAESDVSILKSDLKNLWTYIHRLEARIYPDGHPWEGDTDLDTLREQDAPKEKTAPKSQTPPKK